MFISTAFRRVINVSRCESVLHRNNNQSIFNIWRSVSTVNHSANNNIVYSRFDEIKFPELSIPEYVYQNFGNHPNKIAVECSSTGRKYTYEELRRRSKNFAGALQRKLKLRRGDVIALMLPNIPEFPICLLGALEAGMVVTTVNTSYIVDEVSKQLFDSESKLVITVAELWPVVQGAVGKYRTLIPIVVIKLLQSETLPNGTINFQECIDTKYDSSVRKDLDFDDVAILPYSSGTTGHPKGVELSTRNIVCNMEQMQGVVSHWGSPTTDTYQDVVANVLPWFHIYGISVLLLLHLSILSKLISVPKFSVNSYINMLINNKPNILFIVPPIAVLMNNPSVKQEHLQSVSMICSGAAPLGLLEEQKLEEKINKRFNIIQGYGLTETAGCIMLLLPERKKQLKIIGSVGEPLGSMSMKIAPVDNPSGLGLGPNQCGELLLKGPTLTKSYRNKPEETQKAFVEGWFRTGDVAYYDSNNYFYITDRVKELIKVKGYQVAPAELEDILRAYPGVAHSAVIGVPHPVYGEVPKAFIVQHKDANICTKKVEEFVASKVADFKQLKGGVVLIESIPVSPSGKLLRKDLKLLHE